MNFDVDIKHITNKELLENQLNMLREFLEKGAISQQQYNTSVAGLQAKMKA